MGEGQQSLKTKAKLNESRCMSVITQVGDLISQTGFILHDFKTQWFVTVLVIYAIKAKIKF